ncbi:general secretion pathway protein GspK [Persephonella sp.]
MIVLIISVIAFMISIFTIRVSRQLVRSSNMLMDKLHARLAADSVIAKLEFYAATGKFNNNYIENRAVLRWPSRIYIDGRVTRLDNATVSIKDSGGMISVWTFIPSVMRRFLGVDNVTQSKSAVVVDSIQDWYDRDNIKRVNGAESSYYERLGCKYTPRNFSGVQSIYEWHLIRGLMDNKTFNKVKPFIILAPQWHANINTMDEKMLSTSFNIPLITAKTLINLRKKKGSISLFDVKRITGKSVDAMLYGTFPTFVLDIKLYFRFNDAVERMSSQIFFKADNETPYRILEWQN